MSAALSDRVFQYAFPSAFEKQKGAQTLRLATFNIGRQANPFFFEGQLAHPKHAANLLRSTMAIVQSRFHIPAAMLARILAESDPVVTCNDDRIRFEGFSACCGVYARADFLPDSFDGTVKGRGTTNVDFNQPMLAALARVKASDNVSLAVGADKVVLKKMGTEVVEKKVKLPTRWMKGFVEVQTVQSRMQCVHQVDGLQALRFLRTLPRMKTHRRETFVVKSGAGLRLSQVRPKEVVRVGGLERLTVLSSLAKDAERMDIFADELTGASGWVLHFSDSRFHLILSPEVWRGFSGEGQALANLARTDKSALAQVRAELKWQAIIDPKKLAKSTNLKQATVDTALATLGTRGLVGFDLAERTYFHRELPFDISEVEKQQPRLIAARKLIADEKVKLQRQTKTSTVFRVKGSDVEHRVTVNFNSKTQAANFKCTCPWFNKHANSRGPCKHILAAQMTLEKSTLD